MNQELLGKNIAKLRKASDYTQEALAEKLNIDRTTVSKWERGISSPDIVMLKEICNIFQVSINDIFDTNYNDNSQCINKKENTNDMIEALKFYENRKKKKIIKWSLFFIFIILFISILSFLIYKANNYYFYTINENKDNISVNGVLLYSKKRQILLIKNINYYDGYIGTDKELKADAIKIILKSKNVELYSYSIINSNNLTISELLDNMILYYDSDKHDNKYSVLDKEIVLYFEITNGNELLTSIIEINLGK